MSESSESESDGSEIEIMSANCMGVSAVPHRMSVCSAPCDLLRGIGLDWRRRLHLEGRRGLGRIPVATNAQNKHHTAHKVTNEQHGNGDSRIGEQGCDFWKCSEVC